MGALVPCFEIERDKDRERAHLMVSVRYDDANKWNILKKQVKECDAGLV